MPTEHRIYKKPPPTPDELRRWRRKCGLSQTEAAALVGVTRRSWVRYESSPLVASHVDIPEMVWNYFKLRTTAKHKRSVIAIP